MKKINFMLTGALTAALIFPGTALGSTITVDRGDTLSKLAVENKTTVAKLKTANNLKSDRIYVGQKLQTTSQAAITAKTGVVANATYLNVRTGPGVSYKSFTVIKKDTKVVIDSQKNGWMHITIGTKKGYVSGKYIKTTGIVVSKKIVKVKQASAKVAVASIKTVVASTKVFNRPSEGAITSTFGPRWGTEHKGIDFAKVGTVQIKSAEAGVVSRSFVDPSYGEVVFIKHVINGKNYETVYAHMKSGSRTVKVGQRVASGQTLGLMGSTGHSTGQHLHFEVHLGSYQPGRTTAVNPFTYIK